jgi:capsular exopolysaccharide synthesis family protein
MRIHGEQPPEPPADGQALVQRTGIEGLQPAATPPPPAPVAEAREDSIPLDAVAGALVRRKRLLAAAALLGVAAGIGFSMLLRPVYRARTSLQLEGFNDAFLRDVAPVSPTLVNATAEQYLQNQVKLLQSETLAKRVADRLGATVPGDEERRIRTVGKAITVRTSLQSQVIELFYDAPDAVGAQNGANIAAQEFIALNREARDKLVQDTTEWLTRETAGLKQKLEQASRALQEYARASGLVFAGGQSTLAEDRIRQTQQALAAAEMDRAAKQARYEAAAASSTEGLPDVLATAPLRQYQAQREDLRRQLADLQTVFTPAHYKVRRVQAQLAELEQSIAKERKEILGRLATEYAAAAGLERLLRNAHGEQLKEVELQAEKGREYAVRKHEVDSTQALYDFMLQKVKEAGAASALRASNVRVIDPARRPSRPYSPNLPLNAAIGLVFGLCGGLGLVFARERTDRVKQPGDALLINVPELGAIPSARDDRGLGYGRLALLPKRRAADDLALVTWDEESSLLSESFRATLASILFSSNLAAPRATQGGRFQGRVLVVTSSQAMEGKTTVLTNLGIALAETNRRVLLVDADLRRPSLHRVFDICNDWGLTDLIQSADSAAAVGIESVARPTRVPNLWLMPSGPGADAIPRLLYSLNFKGLLKRLRADFDLILIDTPPMMLYSDMRVIGRISDGVVMVVRANRTSRDELRSACRRLEQDGIPLLGTVLNDWRIDHARRHGYGDYYRHYRPAKKER